MIITISINEKLFIQHEDIVLRMWLLVEYSHVTFYFWFHAIKDTFQVCEVMLICIVLRTLNVFVFVCQKYVLHSLCGLFALSVPTKYFGGFC